MAAALSVVKHGVFQSKTATDVSYAYNVLFVVDVIVFRLASLLQRPIYVLGLCPPSYTSFLFRKATKYPPCR